MLKLTDKILSPRRGDAATALAYLDRPDAKDRAYVDALWRWCGVAGVDFAIALAWSYVETADLTSTRWIRDTQPAGIGIPADSTVQPFVIPDGAAASRLHVQCLFSIVERELHPLIPLWPEAETWLRRVWLPKVNDPRFPRVERLTDLDIRYRDSHGEMQATWAWGHQAGQPAQAAIAKAARVWPDLPNQQEDNDMALTFGKVPHPPFQDRYIPDSQNGAWNDLGQRRPFGAVQHSMIGTLMGTDGWFRRGRISTGLTDYGIGGSTDGALDGVIFRWNDPRGRRAGWANGTTDGLEGDGPLFVRTLGVNAVNRDLVSIERSDGGNINTPMSPKQFESICALTAYWFDQAKVPWDRFPLNPALGIVTHFLHYEFATKACAFPPVNDRIGEVQNRVRAIMKAAQTKGTEEPTTPPVHPPQPPHDRFPFGWTAKQLKGRFGEVPYNEDGQEGTRHFALTKEPAAGIVNAWIQRAEEEERERLIDLPRPQRWIVLTNDSGQRTELFTFAHESGWVLIRPPGENATWTWAN